MINDWAPDLSSCRIDDADGRNVPEIRVDRLEVPNGVDPFDRVQFNQHLREAHIGATIVELHYVREWAKQAGLETSELALEAENPDRRQYSSHRDFIVTLQKSQAWPEPTPGQLRRARQFWDQLLKRGTV